MHNFDYRCGWYDVVTTFNIQTVPYFGVDDDKGWFRVYSGKIKGDSTHLRLVEQRGTLVSHKGVIDWDSTFFFLHHDIHKMIDEKFLKL